MQLSTDGKIIVIASSMSALTASFLFLLFGYLCGVYHQKLRQQPPPSVNQPTPVYEDILTTGHDQNLELNTNIAYASVQ